MSVWSKKWYAFFSVQDMISINIMFRELNHVIAYTIIKYDVLKKA